MSDHPLPETDPCHPLPAQEACRWALDAMAARDWELAARRWAILRAAYPDHPPVWIHASLAYRNLQHYRMASDLLAEARRRFPRHPGGWLQAAIMAMAEADNEEASALLQEARTRFPKDARVWLHSADLAFTNGETESAQEYNRHLREAFQDEPRGYIQYAEFAMRTEEWKEASRRWALLRERFPEELAGYRRGAVALQRLGKKDEARELQRARQDGQRAKGHADNISPAEDLVPLARRGARAFCELVWTKAWLNLKSETSKNHLHYLWWVIEPLMFMVVYYMVFAALLDRGGNNYVAYLLSGIVPFQWFAKTTQQASSSIMQGKGLMQSVRITPLFFPLVSLVQNAAKQIPVFVLLAVLISMIGHPPNVHWLGLIPIILLQLLLLGIIGCSLALVIPFVRDVANLVPIAVNFTLFVSGVFYTLDTIPPQWQQLFLMNPMANLLYQYRLVLVQNAWPDWWMAGGLFAACLVASAVLWWVYRKVEMSLPRVVVE